MGPDGCGYATSKFLKWHRRLSISVVTVLFTCYAVHFGIGLSVRHFAVFVVPLILIWFSDDLSEWGSGNSGAWFSASRGDTYVRICAWLILGLLAVLRIMSLVAEGQTSAFRQAELRYGVHPFVYSRNVVCVEAQLASRQRFSTVQFFF